ncbi:MAG: MFS transporter [Alphaproteobacteria bacterium]|nr:MFS transporter [Alphaproteobacteria bacterium]
MSEARDYTTRERVLGLLAAYTCVGGTTVALGLSLPLLPLAIEAAGHSRFFNGLNAATGAVALLVTSPLVPWVSARMGTIRLLVVCFLLASVSLVALPYTPIWAWFPLRFSLNAALQGLFVISEIWINTLAPEKARGRLVGIYGIVATAGFALGPVVAAQFPLGSPVPFLAGAGAILAGLAPVLAARQVAPPMEQISASGLLAVAGIALIPIMGAAVHALGETAATSFLPVFAVREGWLASDALLLITAFGVGNVVLQVPIGWLSDVWSRRAVLTGCAALSAVVGLLIPLASGDPVLLTALAFLWGGFLIGIYTVGLTLVGQIFAGPRLAAASAAFAFAYAAGSILGPGTAGLAMDIVGGGGLGWFVAVVCGLYAIAGAIAAKRLTSKAR